MSTRRIVLPILVVALVAAAFVLPFGSSSNSNANAVTAPAEPITAFTVMDNGQGLCDLYTIDLATGALTDLPAASSEAACALDLAVAANGTVYGIGTTTGFFSPGSVAPAADSLGSPELTTFSADGTPSGLTLTVGGFPISSAGGGSIAIDAAGTVYVIVVNETTCYPSSGPKSFEPSDTTMFSCLFTVNLSSGELTQIGDGFSPDQPVFGLTSCASDMWSLMPGLIDDFGVGQSPASVGVPWASSDPTTAIPTEAGMSTQLLGFDCVATSNTVYAMSTGFGLTTNDITPSAPAGADLGTVDPTTGVFTETAATSNPSGYIFPWAFAVLPIPVEPEPETETEPAPVAPIFTR